jgi:hypothetical protein
MNLDGETNLKDRELAVTSVPEHQLKHFTGELICDVPDSNLDHWEGNLKSS